MARNRAGWPGQWPAHGPLGFAPFDAELLAILEVARSARVATWRWCAEHRDALARWLPERVVHSSRRIVYVLLHGDDAIGTGWTPRWLTPAEAAAFLEFLEPQLTASHDILDALRRRAREPSR